MLIGYARIATAEESLDHQREALERAEVERLYCDVTYGANTEHPQRKRALSELQPGDTLVVWRLDRLDRTVHDLVETIENLCRSGIGFRSLEENIDTTTDSGKLLWHFFAALLQSDRNLAQERTAVRRATVRGRAQKGGRKPKLDEEGEARAIRLYSQGTPV